MSDVMDTTRLLSDTNMMNLCCVYILGIGVRVLVSWKDANGWRMFIWMFLYKLLWCEPRGVVVWLQWAPLQLKRPSDQSLLCVQHTWSQHRQQCQWYCILVPDSCRQVRHCTLYQWTCLLQFVKNIEELDSCRSKRDHTFIALVVNPNYFVRCQVPGVLVIAANVWPGTWCSLVTFDQGLVLVWSHHQVLSS